MKKIIYAKQVSENVLKDLNPNNKIHSIFENGINIKGQDGLIFIGSEKRGRLPFGIHLKDKDIKELTNVNKEDIFKFNPNKKHLTVKDRIIDLNKAKLYSPKLPKDETDTKDKDGRKLKTTLKGKHSREDKTNAKGPILDFVLEEIIKMDLTTGLDLTIREILSKENPLIQHLKDSLSSQDIDFIKTTLQKIIGRGRGLTPSGDDLLIGLIWFNNIKSILSQEFIQTLKELILANNLTTDISINYYKAAFKDLYSSTLIDLYKSIKDNNKEAIKLNLRNITNYGHTSGYDTLSGIALAIDRA